MSERKLRTDTIHGVKLDRIESNARYIRRNPVDGPMISRFGYDHGHLLIIDSTGKKDLLADRESNPLVRDVARLLCEISPGVVEELVRGYKLARAAGLLGDGKINPEVAKLAVLGERVSDKLRAILQKANRQPGGIAIVDEGVA